MCIGSMAPCGALHDRLSIQSVRPALNVPEVLHEGDPAAVAAHSKESCQAPKQRQHERIIRLHTSSSICHDALHAQDPDKQERPNNLPPRQCLAERQSEGLF